MDAHSPFDASIRMHSRDMDNLKPVFSCLPPLFFLPIIRLYSSKEREGETGRTN